MLRVPVCVSKYIIFTNNNYASVSINKQEQYKLLRFGCNALRHKMRAGDQLPKFQYSEK